MTVRFFAQKRDVCGTVADDAHALLAPLFAVIPSEPTERPQKKRIPTTTAARGTTLLVAGGGTGGHIYPALAVAQEYLAAAPGRSAVFVGTARGLETKIVPRAGFPLELIRVAGLKGKSIGQTITNLFLLPLGVIDAWRILSRHRPAAVLGVGGYASGPALAVAALRGIPTLIHEQNAYPGLTNRLLARFVKAVAVAFAEALPRLHRQGVVTGNPVRREFFDAPLLPQRQGRRARILIFGGSQGSRILNDTMIGALLFLSRLKGEIEIVHQTGTSDHPRVVEAYRASAFPESRIVAYLDPMSTEIAAADLVVSRAGAMTIGELCASGRASILVPFALATNNHQEINARVVEAAGGAIVIVERELTPERLGAAIQQIMQDQSRALRMGESARRLARPDAAAKIVEIIERIQRN